MFVFMKNCFLVSLVLLLFFSCAEKEEEPYLNLSNTILIFPWTGESQKIIVETNAEWNITGTLPSWIEFNINSNTEVEFIVEANETGEKRSCSIIFSVADKNIELVINQEAEPRLFFKGAKKYDVLSTGSMLKVEIEHNVLFDLTILDSSDTWIHQNNDNSEEGFDISDKSILYFLIDENLSSYSRIGKVVISSKDCILSDTLVVEQKAKEPDGSTDYFVDGFYRIVNQGLSPKTNLIVMGDGFTEKDLGESAYYENSMNKAIEYFFSIEPYKSYREYFNVYMVVAESEEEGVGEKEIFGGNTINNKFGTAFGDGTEIICNDELIFEYARKVKELPEDNPITVLVVLNSDKYAGTAYLYPDGNSIALCPMSTEEVPNDFEGIVHHEAGGHAFGFLLDEYVYNQSEIPESRKNEIQEWQKMGYQMNLDFTNDLDKILWKDFIGIDKYAPVGAYEGGYEYQYGVWRSEENSCMNDNIPYYNVQSRWSIVNRIMQLSGIEFSVQDFIENDNPVYPTGSRALNNWEKFVPLAEPIWVVK